ncbi:MAG: glycosyltransferase family 25 protein [Chloroflexota bacterium]
MSNHIPDKIKIYFLTVRGSERVTHVEGLRKTLQDDLFDIEIIINEPGDEIDLVHLAAQGIIRLFPEHKITPKLYRRPYYNPGTLGCMVAHHRAFLRIIQNNEPFAIILEDNVVLAPNFKESIVHFLMHFGAEFGIAHLFSNLTEPRKPVFADIYEGNSEWGTSKGQLVSREFAEMMARQIPLYEVSDGITMLPSLPWVKTGLKSFIIIPHLLYIHPSLRTIRQNLDRKKLAYDFQFEKVETDDPVLSRCLYSVVQIFENHEKSNGTKNPGLIYVRIWPFYFDSTLKFVRDLTFGEFREMILRNPSNFVPSPADCLAPGEFKLDIDAEFIFDLSINSKFVFPCESSNSWEVGFRVRETAGPKINSYLHWRHSPFMNGFRT